ncbi:MAG TPA: hypothetical protein VLK65_29905 [Vicinamibacteria bacterium]|nr:hypothetical protein [Vicinamibacteria bacterium]
MKRTLSKFIRSVVERYSSTKRRRDIDAQIQRAYGGNALEMLDEVGDLLGAQEWPGDRTG